MKPLTAAVRSTLFIALLTLSKLSAQTQRGTICVERIAIEAPARVSPGQNYNPATLALRIDKAEATPWPNQQATKLADLDITQRHLLTVTSDGKRLFSFWFKFSSYKTEHLCLSFDGYEGAQLQPAKPYCKCN